ncbi:DUF2500 family protein [bacterium]|nr:MAG: DUF2500 family protein [bacterium]
MDPTREKLTGCALVGGVFLMVASLFLGWVFGTGGVFRGTYTRTPITNTITDAGTLNLLPLTLLFFTVGLLLCIAAVGYGLLYNARQSSGPRRTVVDALILSRYALSPHGNMLSDWELEAAEKPRFYVRMRMPDGSVSEYPVAPETYFNCGEGMAGEAELQGRWIGRFTPYIGPRPNP